MYKSTIKDNTNEVANVERLPSTVLPRCLAYSLGHRSVLYYPFPKNPGDTRPEISPDWTAHQMYPYN